MLTIQLLGGFKIIQEGKLLQTSIRPRGMSLLVYLLLHHATPQDRAHLAYTFWPETSDSQARTNLRRELHHLRKTLPLFDTLVKSDNQSVQWQSEPTDRVDVVQFTDYLQGASKTTDAETRRHCYQAAVDLYHGDLLLGLYDEWVLAKREELRQAFIHALETLTTLLIDERAYTAAVSSCQRLLQYDPLYETGYLQLMELYAVQNDRARACHIYHTCTTVLERELGVTPGEEIERLYQRLLHAAEPAAGDHRGSSATALQLVGRTAEWQRLLHAWRQAALGHAHAFLIEGEAGIGKTRLGEELLEWANRQAITTARTRAYAAEGSLAYTPVIEWLRTPPLRAAIADLGAPWRMELARLLPELLTEELSLPRPEPLTERWQRQRLFEALARAVTVDARPKLLLIDDLQWCDQETLEWLRFLLRFAPAAPLLLLGTVRTEEIEGDHPLHAFTRELQVSKQLTIIELPPLNAKETAALAAHVSNAQLDSAAADHLVQASEGNPLFVVEMVQSGGWTAPTAGAQAVTGAGQPLPPKVYAVIQHRLAQLSPAARTLAALAATIGRSFTFDLLCAASEGGEDEVVNSLDELWRRKVIRERGAHDYDFNHDRIREAAYAELSPMRRKVLHQRAAQALEVIYENDLDPVSGQLALHHERAGNYPIAVNWYQRAGRKSWTIHAFRKAIDYQQAALGLFSELPATQEHLAKELALQIEFAESMAAVTGFTHMERNNALLRARELAQGLSNHQALSYIIPMLSNLYLALGDAPKMHLYAKEANVLVDQVTDPVQKAQLYGAESRILLHVGNFERTHELLVKEIELFKQVYDATRNPKLQAQYVVPTPVFAFVQWIRGYPAQAQQISQHHRVLSDQLLSPYHRVNFAFMTAVLHRNLGNDEVVAAEARILLEFSERYELRMSQYAGNIFGGWLLAKQGNPTLAIEKMRYGLEGLKKLDHVMYHPHRLAMFIEVLLWGQALTAATQVLAQAFDLSERCDQHFWDVELYRLQGDLLLAQGEPDEQAEAAYLRAIEIAQPQGAKSLELRATTALCRLWQRQGQIAQAHQVLSAIYGWFTEGFDTTDLKTAKALLTQLSA